MAALWLFDFSARSPVVSLALLPSFRANRVGLPGVVAQWRQQMSKRPEPPSIWPHASSTHDLQASQPAAPPNQAALNEAFRLAAAVVSEVAAAAALLWLLRNCSLGRRTNEIVSSRQRCSIYQLTSLVSGLWTLLRQFSERVLAASRVPARRASSREGTARRQK